MYLHECSVDKVIQGREAVKLEEKKIKKNKLSK